MHIHGSRRANNTLLREEQTLTTITETYYYSNARQYFSYARYLLNIFLYPIILYPRKTFIIFLCPNIVAAQAIYYIFFTLISYQRKTFIIFLRSNIIVT